MPAGVPGAGGMEVGWRLGMTPHARFDHPGVEAGHPLRPHIAYHLTRS
jgi:hypothetical protein